MHTSTLMSKSNWMDNLRGTHLLPSLGCSLQPPPLPGLLSTASDSLCPYVFWESLWVCIPAPEAFWRGSSAFGLGPGQCLNAPLDLWWKCCYFLPGFPRSWDNLPQVSMEHWFQERERTKPRSLLQHVKSEPLSGSWSQSSFPPTGVGKKSKTAKDRLCNFYF